MSYDQRQSLSKSILFSKSLNEYIIHGSCQNELEQSIYLKIWCILYKQNESHKIYTQSDPAMQLLLIAKC